MRPQKAQRELWLEAGGLPELRAVEEAALLHH